MKKNYTRSIFFLMVALAFNFTNAQTGNNTSQSDKETVLVTFECESCTKRNKFKISGLENHLFIQAEFPIEQILPPGEYEMTYWQNKVQQIHLPFTVDPKIKNVIVLKN